MSTQIYIFNKTVIGGILSIIFLGVLLVLPAPTHAQGNTATAANMQCNRWNPQCPCGAGTILDPKTGQCPGSGNTAGCPVGICENVTNGIPTERICASRGHCKGVTSGGKGVDSMLQQLGQMLQQALSKLGQGGGGGGGGGQPPPPSGGSGGGSFGSVPCANATTLVGGSVVDPNKFQTAQSPGAPCSNTCATYYQVSTPSSDPCAYYVPVNATSTDDLQGAISGDANQQKNTNSVVGSIQNLNTPPLTDAAASSTATSSSIFASLFGLVSNLIPGTNPNVATGPKGGVQTSDTGATVSASSQDAQNNTEVSGFFGAETVGGVKPQGIAAWLCYTRPWTNSILSKIIPDSFFDGLCQWRGYHVGPVVATPTVTRTSAIRTQTQNQAVARAAATSTGSIVPARVQIWAAPASVSIGSRTSVFWSAQGVTNCTETSPDGSFAHDTLSGGASTVPLTNATTYTISCIKADGSPITDSFTVRMAI